MLIYKLKIFIIKNLIKNLIKNFLISRQITAKKKLSFLFISMQLLFVLIIYFKDVQL